MAVDRFYYDLISAPKDPLGAELFSSVFGLCGAGGEDVFSSGDGLFASGLSLSEMLGRCGIESLPGEGGRELLCRNFYDDWYLFCVEGVWGLFKLREQEFDLEQGLFADGDCPGVTVSFIRFELSRLESCLARPEDWDAKRALAREINKVVSRRGQVHEPVFFTYFSRPDAKGSYLLGELYVRFLLSLVPSGGPALPKMEGRSFSRRTERFLSELGVWRDGALALGDHLSPTLEERLTLLALYTGDPGFHAFAAEVRFHALFLRLRALRKLPLLGAVYASAVRADMSVCDSASFGPKPYYRENSAIVRTQRKHHGKNI